MVCVHERARNKRHTTMISFSSVSILKWRAHFTFVSFVRLFAVLFSFFSSFKFHKMLEYLFFVVSYSSFPYFVHATALPIFVIFLEFAFIADMGRCAAWDDGDDDDGDDDNFGGGDHYLWQWQRRQYTVPQLYTRNQLCVRCTTYWNMQRRVSFPFALPNKCAENDDKKKKRNGGGKREESSPHVISKAICWFCLLLFCCYASCSGQTIKQTICPIIIIIFCCLFIRSFVLSFCYFCPEAV